MKGEDYRVCVGDIEKVRMLVKPQFICKMSGRLLEKWLWWLQLYCLCNGVGGSGDKCGVSGGGVKCCGNGDGGGWLWR